MNSAKYLPKRCIPMTAFENNPFNNRPRLNDPFNPLLRELLGPPVPNEQLALPQLRLPQGDLLVQAGGGGGTGEAGILRRRGEEFAALIVGQGFLGASNNRGISEQEGVELTLMLLNRIHQINTAAGAQPGSAVARQRINNFIEGMNRDLHLRGLDLRVDLTFNDQGAVNVSQALLFRWQNDMRNGDSIGRAHIPQARQQEVTQMRERADTFAEQILNGTRLPANGSVPNQTWLRTQLNTHLAAIGTGQGGADRIRLFMLHLGLALRRHNFDVNGPTGNQVRFYNYDNQAHSRGLPASPLLTVEVPAPVVNNPGGNAPEQGGEQQTLQQRIATLINQNWQNANNDGGPTGVAAQFWTAFSQDGEGQFVDRLNAALAGSNHSVAYDPSFHRLILYNGTGNGRTVQRQIDLAIPRPEDARSLTAARALDAYFNNPEDDGQRSRLLALARQYMQHRLAMPGGAQLFEDSVNLRLQEHRRRVVFNPQTRQFSLHTLGADNIIVNPAIATVTIPAPEVAQNQPPPMPPVQGDRPGNNQGPQQQPQPDDPVVVIGRWIGGLCCCLGPSIGTGILAYYLYQRARLAFERNRLAREQVAADTRALRGETAPRMEPPREAPGPRQQTVEEASHVSARQPQELTGNAEAQRRAIEEAMRAARAQNASNPFFAEGRITSYRAMCLEFINALRAETTPGNRCEQLTEFIRRTGVHLFPQQRALFERIHVVENPALEAVVANHTINGSNGPILIEIPSSRVSGPLTGEAAMRHMNEVLGSLYDQLHRVHRITTMTGEQATNAETVRDVRATGNALADYVQFSVNADNAVRVGEHANEGRLALHSSRPLVHSTGGHMEMTEHGLEMRNAQGEPLSEEQRRRAETERVAEHIRRLEAARAELRRAIDALPEGDARRNLEARYATLHAQVQAAQAQHRLLGENTPAGTAARLSLRESFRRGFEGARARLGGRIVPIAMFAEEAIRLWLTRR